MPKKSHINDLNMVRINCRCGGEPSLPRKVENCSDRWIIECKVERCYARNIGEGLEDVIHGWNRLSNHLYR